MNLKKSDILDIVNFSSKLIKNGIDFSKISKKQIPERKSKNFLFLEEPVK